MTIVKSFWEKLKVLLCVLVLLMAMIASQGCSMKVTTKDADGNVISEETVTETDVANEITEFIGYFR